MELNTLSKFAKKSQMSKYMENKIISIIQDIVNDRVESERLEINEFNPDINLRNDLGFSSLELASLTVRIEDEYDIDIFEDGIVNTLGEIVEILKANA